MNDVIVQFASKEDRDHWAQTLGSAISRIYKREPWFAASLTDKQNQSLSKVKGVKIFPDVKLKQVLTKEAFQ